MASISRQAKTDIQIRELALSLVGSVPGKAYRQEIESIFRFVRDDIRYTKDILNVETVQTAQKTLEYRQGDCDDKSVLLAALLESIGFQARFVAVGFSPGHFQHVYTEVFLDGQWIPLDPTEKVSAGWAPPDPLNVMIETV